MGEELAKCNFSESCIATVKSKYDDLSLKHNNEMQACSDDACRFYHAAQIQAGMQALPGLAYGGASVVSQYRIEQEASQTLNKLPPEMKPLADVAGFMIANCGGQLTAACQQKLAAHKSAQMQQAAIIIGAAFAPAVIAGSFVSADAIVGCLANPLCRLEAADQLAGALAGLPTGITGVSAGGAAAGTKLIDALTDSGSAKSTEEMALQLKNILNNNIHRDDDLFTNVAEVMSAAEKSGWKKYDGRTWYPPENGVVPGTQEMVEVRVGQKLDRYGGTSDRSSFLAPANTPMEQRVLPPDTNFGIHDEYIVIKPFKVEQARVMPWFGHEGMGLQFETKAGSSGLTINDLVEKGYLKKVTP